MAKQTTKKDASHYFIDGYPASADMVGVLGYPNALKGTDAEYSTFYMADSSEWTHEKLSFDTRGVIQTRQGSNWTWLILGKRGQVFSCRRLLMPPSRSRTREQGRGATGTQTRLPSSLTLRTCVATDARYIAERTVSGRTWTRAW